MAWGGGWLRDTVVKEGSQEEMFGSVYDHEVVTRLAGYTKPYWRTLVVALFGVTLYALSNSAAPRIIGYAIDHSIGGLDSGGLTLIALVFLANALLTFAGQYSQTVCLAFVGQQVLEKLRVDLFSHTQSLSLRFFDTHEVGILMSRVQNDVLALQELLTNGFFSALQDVLSLLIIVYFMFSMNWKLALVAMTVVPVLVVVMWFWQNMAREAFMRVRIALGAVNADLQENISGVRVIQSLTREDSNIQAFDDVNRAHFEANVHAGKLSASVQPLLELLVAVATALVVYVGGGLVLGEQLAVGELVAFTLYIQRFFEPVRELVLQYTQFQRAMVGGVRIFEVLDTQPEIQDKPDALELPEVVGDVRFDHVEFGYTPGVPVLRGISLHASPGETIALVGQTGAGKSTILSLLLRFYDVTGGSVTIDGHDVRDVTQQSLRRQVGMVLQEPFLFTGTVRENIRFGRPDATDAEVETAAATVGAHDFILRLERGYDTPVAERGGNMSVGQRQLLSFARAVLADPRILILDEATANVDTQTEVVIQQALRKLLQGRTSFVIAHRLSTIRDATRIIVLERGQIAEQGTHAELLALGGIYAGLNAMAYQTVGGSNGNGHGPAPTTPLRRASAAS